MKKKRSFLKDFRDTLLGNRYERVQPDASDRLRLSGKGLGVSCVNTSFSVEMGNQTLHVCPDLPTGSGMHNAPPDFLIFDPQRFHSGISHCLRLRPDETVAIDHRHEHQRQVFTHPKDAFRRHLQISHKGDSLVFRDPISELGTYVSVLDEEHGSLRLRRDREQRLQRIRDLFPGGIGPHDPNVALELVREVNQSLRTDAFRKTDSEGNPGGLLELPPHIKPIIVGDLHAQVDNLLTLLCENSTLDALEKGEAALVLLGDAVHREEKELLSEMDSSLLIMDLILTLKQRFPDRVFFVIGNHDSFSTDVMKGGIPQSVLWKKKLLECRGPEFVHEMGIFYQLSPLVVLSADFLACHAGPPRSAVTIETLVEARQFPEIVRDLTWNRLKTPVWPAGYGKGQVRRFRKSLELSDSTPFIVAHYPQDRTGTLWLNAGEIAQHHILFSARTDQVALFTRVDGVLLPQKWPVRKLLAESQRR